MSDSPHPRHPSDPPHSPLILLVGHCGPDGFMLRNIAQRAVPGARVELVDDDESLRAQLPRASLLLVNRLLDGAMSIASGVELIRSLAREGGEGRRPALMLVSNYPEAQADAEAAGALPGFGKRDAYAEETARRIREAVDRARGSAS